MKTMEKKEINERNNMLFSEVEPSCQMSMAFWDGEPYVRLFSEKRRFSFMTVSYTHLVSGVCII